ncbi:thiaminase II (plasmid) [Nicoliella spurrieriana]|uniref:Aminopyrimidine aminohydrolase n=1 Tax=Nicoliella spurrieriana TaxID=2925830 RepID=A0A976RQK9_9LACO|nr:thiaminase II [Nicoliella spurrieriana]UQS85990.1 thiaminase II [Nicoliella spurrieriana]
MFSDQLKQQAQPILSGILEHPFIQGIANGNVAPAALQFYVQQDFQYLNEFIKIYGNAIAKSNDRELMGFFNDQISFILNSEIHPHHIFCNIARINYEDQQHATPAPKAYLYESHMHRAGETGSLLNILAAFQPCPWTYTEIADHLVAQGAATKDNPFYDWIMFYASDDNDKSMSDTVFAFVDRFAKQASNEELATASQYFLKSCELEWQFWEHAFYQQDWQFKATLDHAKEDFKS